VGTINTAAYGGSQCGETWGSTLDRTGKYLYVYLFLPGDGNSDACAVMQSYQVESNGEFKYLGYVEADGNPQGLDVKPDSIPASAAMTNLPMRCIPTSKTAITPRLQPSRLPPMATCRAWRHSHRPTPRPERRMVLQPDRHCAGQRWTPGRRAELVRGYPRRAWPATPSTAAET